MACIVVWLGSQETASRPPCRWLAWKRCRDPTTNALAHGAANQTKSRKRVTNYVGHTRYAGFAPCADAAQPFERHIPRARKRVLVIGDSTAVGTGAKHSADSLAGRLALDFTDVHIVNRARNGAKTADTCRQLDASEGERYDVVLIHVGGNDILRRTKWRRLAGDVDRLLCTATRLADHVLVTTTPNVGLVPAFFAPLSWWLTLRSRQVRDMFARACERHGAHYANFFHPRAACPFSRDWKLYFAEDRLHPSSACYGYVWRALVTRTPLARWLAPSSALSYLGTDVDELGKERDVECLAQECNAS